MGKKSGQVLLIACMLLPQVAPGRGIDSARAVTIGGIRQWITLKGERDTDPVLLFLHGGPGNSAMAYSDQFTGALQKKFVVVQWDQRESGRTRSLNASPEPLTVSLFEKDAVAMIRYLMKRFGTEKIYLMGHSWGGFLGMLIAARHPELLLGYFAVSPMIWQEESERRALAWMKEDAIHKKNAAELNELDSVTIPFANGKQLYLQRKWMAKAMGQKVPSSSFVESWALKWLPLFNEASRVNFFKEAPELRCPVYFLIGSHDIQTYSELAESYYNTVRAPRKELILFPDAAHSFLTSEQKKLQEFVVRQLTEASN